jgi:type VI secretion system protein ImpK
MTPRFSRAVDGVFVYVIDLLSRIEIDESINHAEEKTQIQSLIDWAEGAVGSCEGWILAKFALVAWIDEVLTQAPWKAREWWDARRLEQDYFEPLGQDAGVQFFQKAREAAECAAQDALEVFYVCVMLGFRGVYGSKDGSEYAEQYDLDKTLDAWIERTAIAVRSAAERHKTSAVPEAGNGAPEPLAARFQFVGMALLTLILAVAAVLALVLCRPEPRNSQADKDGTETRRIRQPQITAVEKA